jgi:hypothetical protein
MASLRKRFYRAFGVAMFLRGFRVCVLPSGAGWAGTIYGDIHAHLSAGGTGADFAAETPAPENRGTLVVEEDVSLNVRVMLNVSSVSGSDCEGVKRSFEPNLARQTRLTVNTADLLESVAGLVATAAA